MLMNMSLQVQEQELQIVLRAIQTLDVLIFFQEKVLSDVWSEILLV